MNHIHQIIWNKTLGAWIVASELAKRGKKRGSIRRKAVILPLLLYASAGFALPTGNELVAGSVNVSTPSAQQQQINQSSQKAIVNWQGFSIGPHESVNIQQPNASAALLNRVVGQDASSIQGRLNANGQVYLINPNGVIFSETARVDVGGLIASTHTISNRNFLKGDLHFTKNNATGSVINHGQIKTPKGGVVALIGEQVENTGGIRTPNGTTALAAGETIDLDIQGNGLVEVKITEAALKAQIKNSGVIQADGGQVIMTAKAAGQLLNTVINNEGIVEARGLVERNGKIVLSGGDSGVVRVSGTLDVSGQSASNNRSQPESSNLQGGKITVSGEQIHINNGAILNADSAQINKQGNIQLVAQQDITLDAGSKIRANNSQGDAGVIHIDSKTGTTLAQGTIEAKATRSASLTKGQTGKGGNIALFGERVGILDKATINASGEKGGGKILVGGDYQGKNPDVHNAKATYIGKGTSIKADAKAHGNGGKVIVWSDEATRAYGNISAKGGSQSGNGGFIETSGHWLDTAGIRINASGPKGQGGNWLLDPFNITIHDIDETTTGPSFPDWTADAPDSAIWNSDINSQLDNGTNVTIYTGGAAGSQAGNITVAADISKEDVSTPTLVGGDATLTLKADNAIIINNGISISSTSNKLNVILNADADGNGAGNIQMDVGSSIFTNGGNIVMGGGSCTTSSCTDAAFGYDGPGDQFMSNGGIVFRGDSESTVSLNSGGGNIWLNGQGFNDPSTGSAGAAHLGIGGRYLNLDSGGGAVTLRGTGGSGIDFSQGIHLEVSSLSSQGSVMTLDGNAGPSATGNLNIGIRLLSVTLESGAGNMTLNGSGGGGESTNYGVYVDVDPTALTASNLSTTGTLKITGTGGGSGTGTDNKGIGLVSASLSAGIMNLTGTGGSGSDFNRGIEAGVTSLDTDLGGSQLTSTGAMTLTGIGGASVTGTNNEGIYLLTAALNSGAGNMTLKAGSTGSDSIYLDPDEASLAGTGNLFLQPVNSATTIGLAGETGTFNLDADELATIANGFSSITIGNQLGTGLVNIGTMTAPGSAELIIFGPGGIKQTGAITFGSGTITGGSDNNLDLVTSAGNYTNSFGDDALIVSGGGRWLIYAANPSSVTKNGLTSDFRQYNTVYGDAINSTGNGFIYESTPGQLNVNTTLTSGDAFNTYGTAPTAVFGYVIGNPTIADNEDLADISGTAVFTPTISSTTSAGGHKVQYSTGLGSTAGYTFVAGDSFLYTVDPATLTAAITGDPTKTYDGNTTATLATANYSLTGFIGEQGAVVTQTAGTYNSANVLDANTVTAALAAADFTANGDTLLSNYSLPISASGTGAITPATLTIIANPDNKIFDGLAYAGGNGVTYAGLVNNETNSVLSGSLSYGGNSQGAINAGAYDITPGGLNSVNYAITYLNGQLTIVNNPVNEPPVQDNRVPLDTSVTYEPPLFSTQYEPPGISVRSDLSVKDTTDEFAGNTPQYCDDVVSTSTSPMVNCQKRPKDEHAIILPTLKIKNSAGRVMRLQMSANKQFLSLLLEDESVRIWDFQRGDQHQIVTRNKNQTLTDISAVDDKGDLVSIASKAGISTQDVIIPTLDDKLAMHEPDIRQFMTSNDGSLLLVSAGADQLSLWDSKHNKKLWQLPYERGVVNGLALTDNKRYGAVLSRQPGSYVLLPADLQLKSLTDAVDIVDLGTGKVIKSLPNVGEQILSMQFKDNDTLQLKLTSGELMDWSIATGSQKTVANFSETITAVDTARETHAYVLLKDGTVRVGDGQGHVLLSIQNKENPFKDAMLLEGDKKLLAVMANGELSLWDVASGKKMLRLFSTQQGWTVMDAFGRFDSSEEAMDNFSWSANEEDIPLDSFSENYYEPGLLSNVIQNQDYLNSNPDMVKDGITLPPKVTLQIAEQQAKGDNLALQLDVYDRGGGIDKIHVYQNGKILGNENVVVTQQSLQENDAEHRVLKLNITPSAGKNTLKVIASNDMGIENSSAELSFDGKTKAYASSLRLLTIGIDQYSDAKLNLDYSVADADLIGQAIKNTSNIAASINLYNENATKPKILAELKDLSQGVQQDVLVIYFAGHGLALGKEWYFLPYETKMQPSLEKIAATGITATELSDIFKNSKIQHILLMVDSCYSGASMDAFSKLQNGQRYFTRKLSRSLGITVMTAAAKDQKAFELKSLGHGLFTYLITQELQEKDATQPVTAHGIAESISQTLPVFSKKMLGSSQEPAVYAKGNDFMLTDVLKDSNKGNASDSNMPVIAPKKPAQ